MPEKNVEASLTQADLQAFEAGKKSLESFSDGQKVLLDKLMRGEDVPVLDTPAELAVKKEEVGQAAVGDKTDVIPKDHVPGTKYKEKADEANTYRQRADAYSKQLDETRAELVALRKQSETKVEPPIKDPNAVWSEKHQLDLASEVVRLKSLVEQGIRGSQTKLEQMEKELADKKLYAELNSFSAEFPELRLSRPFEEANAEYIDFTKKLGATPADLSLVDKYFQDTAFRKEQESKGIKAPKDYDRLAIILKSYHTQVQDKYPTPRAAYLDRILSPDELDKRLREQFVKGATGVVDRISQNKQETAILEPGSSSTPDLVMNEAQMEAWLGSHPYPRTPSEKATMKQIDEYLRARSQGS